MSQSARFPCVCASNCLSLDFRSLRATLEVKLTPCLPGAPRWVTAFSNSFYSLWIFLIYLFKKFHHHLSHPSCCTVLRAKWSVSAWNSCGRSESAVTLTSAVFHRFDRGLCIDIFTHGVCACVYVCVCLLLLVQHQSRDSFSCWFAGVWKINRQHIQEDLRRF